MLRPLTAARWDRRTAAHLANRAGFGATPKELDRLESMGLDGAVAHFVDFEEAEDSARDPDWARPEPERMERLQEYQRLNREMRSAPEAERKALEDKRREMQRGERRLQQARLLELRQLWLDRMVSSPRPLQEKLALFWHGHFATSAVKVRDAYTMWRQYDLFRRHGAGSWLTLLTEVSKDPAMLIWLDQAQSRKQHPNENFAREVMELFTLGEGHYTEKDITEAARALTGWTLNRPEQRFQYRPAAHDSGVKTVLGHTGTLDGDDVLRILASQPQSGRFICGKLWSWFASEDPAPEPVEALAELFRRSNGRFKPILSALFRSEAFYAPAVIRSQVKSPVQWLVGTVRLLERKLPAAPVTSNTLRQLGQELFAPPNVKGWDGGTAWITTNSLLLRYNFAALLVLGREALSQTMRDPTRARRLEGRLRKAGRGGAVNVTRLFTPEERRDRARLIPALEQRFLQSPLREKQASALKDYLGSMADLDDEAVLHAVRLVLCTPDYQLA